MTEPKTTSLARTIGRIVLSVIFVGVGVAHFIVPGDFEAIMPPYLPWHYELVIISGAAVVLLGMLVHIPRIRRQVGWAMVALLVAVFPANVQHAMHPPPEADLGAMAWVRLPFQAVFIVWALWCTRDD